MPPLTPPPLSRVRAPRPAPASTLVHGTDTTGVSAFATGLALRSYGKFRWVDCARSADGADLATRWIFSRGSERPEVEQIDRSVLRSPSWAPSSLRGLVDPASPEEELRLTSYLALPELYQRLGAPGDDGDRAVAFLVANADVLPDGLGALRLDDRSFHESLHQAGLALFTTLQGAPTRRISSVFDRVYAVDVPSGARWSQGQLAVEKDVASSSTPAPVPLRDVWRTMDLDPTLLPAD